MLKVQASYSKKVPAESEYSSQAYHCTIEMELPDGLTPQQLNERVHGVFAFVRASVESELHNAGQPQVAPAPQTVQVQPAPQPNYQAVVSQPQSHAAPSARPRSGGSRGNAASPAPSRSSTCSRWPPAPGGTSTKSCARTTLQRLSRCPARPAPASSTSSAGACPPPHRRTPP